MFFGDVGPAEVQSHRLPADDPAQHERSDGLTPVQIDVLPEPLIAAPGEKHSRYLKGPYHAHCFRFIRVFLLRHFSML